MGNDPTEKKQNDEAAEQPETNENQSEEVSENEKPEIEMASRVDLESKLNEAEAQVNSLRDQLLRAQAETQNVQRRYEKKIADVEKYAVQAFVKELLGVIDSLEGALREGASQAGLLFEGIQRTYDLFLSTVSKFGVKPVDPKGEIFNPEFHEAMSIAPAESEDQINRVVQVLQKGYALNERLI